MNEVTDTPDHSAPDAAPEHPPRRRWRAARLAATLTAAVVAVGAVAVTGGTDDDPARPKSSRTHEGITAEDLLVGVAGEGTVYRSSDSGERWQGNDGPPGDLQALDVTPSQSGERSRNQRARTRKRQGEPTGQSSIIRGGVPSSGRPDPPSAR